MTELSHWGSLKADKKPEAIPDVTADVELSMNKLYFNGLDEEHEISEQSRQIVVPPLSNLVMRAITLHKHANYIQEMINRLYDSKLRGDKVALKVPPYLQGSREPSNDTGLNFSAEDLRNHSENKPLELCELNRTVVRQILLKSVASLFAQIGYETSQQSALDVLTDVLQGFLQKICLHLKVAIDDEEIREYSGFPHVIERVLTELGLGGVNTLDDFYKTRVIKYLDVLEERCQEMTEEYETLTTPQAASSVDKSNKIVRVKVEEEDVIEVENCEGHFSAINGDVNFSILETGYQLLDSLEAEANLPNITDSVEEMGTVTESPGIASLSDDISHASPYNKKKRYK